MQKEILSELEDLRDETEFIINNEEIVENVRQGGFGSTNKEERK